MLIDGGGLSSSSLSNYTAWRHFLLRTSFSALPPPALTAAGIPPPTFTHSATPSLAMHTHYLIQFGSTRDDGNIDCPPPRRRKRVNPVFGPTYWFRPRNCKRELGKSGGPCFCFQKSRMSSEVTRSWRCRWNSEAAFCRSKAVEYCRSPCLCRSRRRPSTANPSSTTNIGRHISPSPPFQSSSPPALGLLSSSCGSSSNHAR